MTLPEFAVVLGDLLVQRGMSARALAAQIPINAGQLSRILSGQRLVTVEVAKRCDEILGTDDLLAGAAQRARAARTALGRGSLTRRDSGTGVGGVLAGLEPSVDIARRVQRTSRTNVSPAALDAMAGLIDDTVADYERVGPAMLVGEVVAQRRWVDELLSATQPPRERLALFDAAARMSGLLAAMALDLGHSQTARNYGEESFALAEMVDDPDLMAWARGTQSLVAYYSGRYVDAAELARDGLRHSRGGPQSIRLAINGQARALARLGDTRAVESAVDQALGWLTDHDEDEQLSPSLTFGSYCRARTAGNAATAFVSIGDIRKASEFAVSALATFDASDLVGPRALTRIDLATALLVKARPDAEQAADLVVEALTISPPQQFRAVRKRSVEFLHAATERSELPVVRDVRELLAVPEPARSERLGG
jgi:tetratricopeptide (TPR) repeat protein